MKKCGVYKITNTVNNKIYIGGSKNIYKRWENHVSKLKVGNHANSHLQSAWNKYGSLAFNFRVLEFCGLHELETIEQLYLDSTQCCNKNFGYNIVKTANARPMTNETKRKIGLANKGNTTWIVGKHHTQESKNKIRAAVLKNNPMRGKSGCLHQFWGKKHSDATKLKMSMAKLGKYNNASSKSVIQLKEDIEIGQFPSAAQAERETGIDAKNIAACLKGKRNKAGGFQWKYYSERIS